MTFSLIVAMAEGRMIGKQGGLPWHLPADLARFKRLTMGHTIVMGRKTYESIGRPLPGRTTVVITRRPDFSAPAGVLVATSLEAAFVLAPDDDEVFVVGGAEIYRQALPLVQRMYVTRIHATVAGDVRFPRIEQNAWRLREETYREPDMRNPLPVTFQVYQRQTSDL